MSEEKEEYIITPQSNISTPLCSQDICRDEDVNDFNPEVNKCKIIVLSGGGTTGLSFYGLLRELERQKVWNIENIKSIYGTSVGALLAVILSLKYDWETLDDYLIKRPWQQVFHFDMFSIFKTIHERGLYDCKIIENIFAPLFKAKDISMDITMEEFFELTHIDIHLFTTDINVFMLEDISYKTHPKWRVLDAVFCSCSLPIIFKPLIKDGKCYSDGGLIMNYPLEKCLSDGNLPSEILGICRKSNIQINVVHEESTVFDYLLTILNKSVEKILNIKTSAKIGWEYHINAPPISLSGIFNTASSMEERIRLIQLGVDTAKPPTSK